MEKNEKKSEKKVIKCTDCGFKYYDGDIHKCQPISQPVSVEEKPKEKKLTIKTRKESFKIWKDSKDS